MQRRTGWGVAHISYTRLDRDEVWGWDHVGIADRIGSRFADFLDDAPASRLDPRFYEAREEIIEFRANMSAKQHPFEPEPNPPVGTPIHPSAWLPPLSGPPTETRT